MRSRLMFLSVGFRWQWRFLIVGLMGLLLTVCETEAAEPPGLILFRESIEPVLKSQCFECHSSDAKSIQGGLLLDSKEGLLRGGDTGPAIVLGKSEDSLLIHALRHDDGLAMPPQKAKLSDATISSFARWIDDGVPGLPERGKGVDPRKHWAFQPIASIVPPAVRHVLWVMSPVDSFVAERLEKNQLDPATVASREELIRRVTFDLTGLPPSFDDVEAFVQDSSPDAYERVVDRLLGSPRYGERWAQHWLDVVRYAETEGYEYDRTIPDAWRYRDYVIDSLNRDKPFDQFVAEQIAGDEMDPASNESLVATIFHRLGPVRRNAGNPDIALSRNEVLTDRTDILGAAFLGMTVGCARCHNHKLEPISQRDYYQLQAYMSATQEHNIVMASPEQQAEWDAATKKITSRMQELKKGLHQAKGTEKEAIEAMIDELEDQLPPPLPTIPSTRNDFKNQTVIHVLKRGVWENKGEAVGPRPPGVLVSDDLAELNPNVHNPRTQLARWLTSEKNPLTARVIVNRLWQHHMGQGIVKTANDFGFKGDRPSHPELLDWLTRKFLHRGWQWKLLHRTIVLSNTYRQSSRPANAASSEAVDPDNRLLSHASRRRLSAEEVRDAMLVVSGRMNLKMAGPGVIVPVDNEMVQLLYKPSQWTVTADKSEHARRSIYLFAKRNLRLPFMESLDAPTLQSSCARRDASTHAPQALELLNGELSNELAQAFARRIQDDGERDPERMIVRAFELAFSRRPTNAEMNHSLAFLKEQPASEFALALFNLNEFLYVR